MNELLVFYLMIMKSSNMVFSFNQTGLLWKLSIINVFRSLQIFLQRLLSPLMKILFLKMIIRISGDM